MRLENLIVPINADTSGVDGTLASLRGSIMRFGQSLTKTFGGIGRELMTQLEAADTTGEFTSAREQLTEDIDAVKSALAADLLPVALDVVNAIRDLVAAFTNLSPEAKKTIAFVAGLLGVLGLIGPVIVGIAGMITSPFLLIGALIVGLILYFKMLGTRIAESVAWWKERITSAKDSFIANFNTAKTKLLSIWDGIKSGIKNAIDSIKGWISNMIPDIKMPAWLENFLPGSPTPFELGIRGIDKALGQLDLRGRLAPGGEPVGMAAPPAPAPVQPIDYERLGRAIAHEVRLVVR